MRTGLTLSAAVHLSLVALAVALAGPAPFDVEPADGILVDLVTPEEAQDQTSENKTQDEIIPAEIKTAAADEKPAAAAQQAPPPAHQDDAQDDAQDAHQQDAPQDAQKEATKEPPKEAPQPATQAPSPAEAQVPPAPVIAGLPPSEPPPAAMPQDAPADEVSPPFAPDMLMEMARLNRPGEFDAEAEEQAKLTADEIAAFKASVQKCWTRPATVPAAAKLQTVVRVTFKPNGALAGDPMLIAAPASRLGPALVRAAQAAVKRCQPYASLPAGKYPEWRVLDLRFTPAGVSGG